MSFISILFTGLALSMDAFAVSITKGMTIRNLSKSMMIKMSLAFGLFQGGMPLLGWLLGIGFEGYIKSVDHWVALILLSIIGINMIKAFYEDRKKDDSAEIEYGVTVENVTLSNKEIIMLAIATSIDALAIGISFAFLSVNIVQASIIICIITFIMCLIGVIVGNKIGDIFNGYAELIGGVILILIGINIFNEHTKVITNIINTILNI